MSIIAEIIFESDDEEKKEIKNKYVKRELEI